MAKIRSKERVIEYAVDFKIKVVELTEKLDADAIKIAEIFGLHPVMVCRWRQVYREGKFVATPTRRIHMTKEEAEPKPDETRGEELARLTKEGRGSEEGERLPKKVGTVSEGSKAGRFRFIETHRDAFGVRYLSKRLAVSPAGFYKWVNRKEPVRGVKNRALAQEIKQIFVERNTPSMNRPKHVTDNTHVESFFRAMKTESFKGLEFGSMNKLRVTLSWYIDNYYNTQRRHSGLCYKIPSDYEQRAARTD